MKNKTFATWLTFLGGPLGLHRFYLRGLGDLAGWLLPIFRKECGRKWDCRLPWLQQSRGSCLRLPVP